MRDLGSTGVVSAFRQNLRTVVASAFRRNVSTAVASAFRRNVSTGVASAFRRNWLLLTVFRLLAAAATAGAQDQPLAFAPPAAGIAVTTSVEYAVASDA